MEILEWLHLVRDLDLNHLSLNLQPELVRNASNIIFLGYLLVSVLLRKAVFIAAFFICVLLVDNVYLLKLDEWIMYLTVMVIYLHVFEKCLTNKSKKACGIIICISVALTIDAYYFGVGGIHGASETVIYRNIEYISLWCHLFFINSLIPYSRIRQGLQRLSHSFSYFKASVNNFIII